MNQSSVPCSILTVASWPAYRFPRRQVRWSGTPISLIIFHSLLWSTWSKDFPDSSAGKDTTSNTGVSGNMDLIPGSGRFPWGGNGNPLQYSCLENPMNRGAGGLQSIGLQRVGHDWNNWAPCIHTVKGFSIVSEADYRCFSGIPLLSLWSSGCW